MPKDTDSFDEAILLRKVSDTYLAVLFQDNQADEAKGFRALIEFELQRRAAGRSERSISVAAGTGVVAAFALLIKIVSELF